MTRDIIDFDDFPKCGGSGDEPGSQTICCFWAHARRMYDYSPYRDSRFSKERIPCGLGNHAWIRNTVPNIYGKRNIFCFNCGMIECQK